MFQGEVSVASNMSPLVVWLTTASQRFQKTRVANFPTFLPFYSCVTLGRNPDFTVHAECYIAHAFRAAI